MQEPPTYLKAANKFSFSLIGLQNTTTDAAANYVDRNLSKVYHNPN